MNEKEEFAKAKKQLNYSIKPTTLLIPIVIGISVVFYLIYKQTDGFIKIVEIDWTTKKLWYIIIASLLFFARHLLMTVRLYLLSDKKISFSNSIIAVTIIEFISTVMPTKFGGTAVSFYVFYKEGLSIAKGVAINIYLVLMYALYFVLLMPVLILIMGPIVIKAGLFSISDAPDIFKVFVLIWVGISVYGGILFYGLFINPKTFHRIAHYLANIPWLSRLKNSLLKIGEEIEISSSEFKAKPLSFHISMIFITFGAWFLRFFSTIMLVLAFTHIINIGLKDWIIMIGRGEAMFALSAYIPIPGGSGVEEFVFHDFYGDYVDLSVSFVVVLIWRLISYYSYMLAGVFVVPRWLKKSI